MATHPALQITGVKEPLKLVQAPTPKPQQNEVQVRIEWVPSAPLDVYQADAGLMVQFPQGLGDSGAGTVVAVGPGVERLRVGDQVFGFFFHNEKEKGQQIYVTAPEHLFGKVPPSVSLAAAVTVPTNFCTAFLTLSDKLGLDLPWPHPSSFTPQHQDAPILIWGAASSVGQFAVQILKHWGYTNVIATASSKHHEKIKGYGAKHVIDYQDPNAVDSILKILNTESPATPIRAFDCVSSKSGSLQHIAKIATLPGSIVAAVLPVVTRSPSDKEGVQVSADVAGEAPWMSGVEVHPVISYAYEANAFLKDHLFPDIVPALLESGAIEPNKYREIEGDSFLQRATKALDTLRSGAVSGERLVWKVWTKEEYPQYE
ncbi:chaperonin 10-like protein [Aspergillus tamarii]|uniref:Chaperonin 10-like protein n=1 Tax=Aspergillus tamarii TaxID=41984 RepID=A0A5N6UJ31_ASPTM|nr:chaperonin 10-like protein [Aspergillus tamarii]